ncbi:YmaF family protein [Abyssisolibacter fermentans]|uniref:YmaF family protein n=1 Tax=Abyssisolibacter fermentans TaxID=1766203 RepID=UPI00082EA0D6|nr:YmaF family protein [Abyssisolibacter fermentans]
MTQKNEKNCKQCACSKDTCNEFQTHVHEFSGSTMLGAPQDRQDLLHNHRFAGVTGPEIEKTGGHVHILSVNSDFFFNHFHDIEVETGPPIPVKDQNGNVIGHIHGFSGTSSCVFFHDHNFKGSTLIQNPIQMQTLDNFNSSDLDF